MKLVIATRSSKLALYQSEWVKQQLLHNNPDLQISFLKVRDMARISKDSFVKACEEALLTHRAELAVHSAKDVPVMLPQGLVISAWCNRQEARDALITSSGCDWQQLKPNARIGTASLRRKHQLLALRPDLRIIELRGNIETRLAALKDLDAVVLSTTALQRLGYADRISYIFTVDEMVPAPGQGALAIEQRQVDSSLRDLIYRLNHQQIAACVLAERSFCRHLGVDCDAPVGAYASLTEEGLHLSVALGSHHKMMRDTIAERVNDNHQAEEVGRTLAVKMLAQGAQSLLH